MKDMLSEFNADAVWFGTKPFPDGGAPVVQASCNLIAFDSNVFNPPDEIGNGGYVPFELRDHLAQCNHLPVHQKIVMHELAEPMKLVRVQGAI